jgi:cytoskeleton protein RodZ
LELKFAAPAWVEVRDHTGRIIYSQLNAAGTTQFITGAAPLDVLIGNARQVQARWRDEPVKLDKLTGDDVSRQVLR